MTLSPAAAIVLTRAADRPDCFLEFSRKLPAGARCKMIGAMLRDGLVAETAGDYRRAAMTEDAETGMLATTLRLTVAGHVAIGREPPAMTEADIEGELDLQQAAVDRESMADEPPQGPQGTTSGVEASVETEAPDSPRVAPRLAGLRRAAMAVLTAWDDKENRLALLEGPMANLRVILTGTKPRSDAPRKPREGTKQEAVLTLLRRAEGATIVQVMEATGWASHTVRGFFAGLKKKGIGVQVKERVKQAAPGTQGAKGSYSVYHVPAV